MSVSEFRKQKLYFVFDQFFDADKSGEIEKKDFEIAVERICNVRKWAPGTPKYEETKKCFLEVWDALKLRADDNGDDQVSRDEWLQLWASPSNDDWQKLYMKFMFNLQDTSGDGSVDLEEFTAVCSCFGVSIDDSKKAFEVVSKNGGAVVDSAYYSKLWQEFFYSDDKNAPGNAIFGKKSF